MAENIQHVPSDEEPEVYYEEEHAPKDEHKEREHHKAQKHSGHPEKKAQHSGNLSSKIENFYDKHYKKMAILPLIIGLIAIGLILGQYFTTGEFMNRGIGLKGGTTVSIQFGQEIDTGNLEKALAAEFPDEEFNIRILKSQGVTQSISIETSLVGTDTDKIIPIVSKELGKTLTDDDYSIETIGSTLSESFFNEMIKILLIAFVLMAVVVFFTFKSVVPSLYIVLCAFLDMVITLAIVNLTGLKITTGGIAAFLMLIDFSIDTDTLLTAKVLKREAGVTPAKALIPAFITGLTMTATAFVAMLVAYLLTNSMEIKQMMLILLVGLLVDMVVTWMQSASLCLWYVKNKEKRHAR